MDLATSLVVANKRRARSELQSLKKTYFQIRTSATERGGTMCVDTGFKSRLYLINEVWDRVLRFHPGPQRFG